MSALAPVLIEDEGGGGLLGVDAAVGRERRGGPDFLTLFEELAGPRIGRTASDPVRPLGSAEIVPGGALLGLLRFTRPLLDEPLQIRSDLGMLVDAGEEPSSLQSFFVPAQHDVKRPVTQPEEPESRCLAGRPFASVPVLPVIEAPKHAALRVFQEGVPDDSGSGRCGAVVHRLLGAL